MVEQTQWCPIQNYPCENGKRNDCFRNKSTGQPYNSCVELPRYRTKQEIGGARPPYISIAISILRSISLYACLYVPHGRDFLCGHGRLLAPKHKRSARLHVHRPGIVSVKNNSKIKQQKVQRVQYSICFERVSPGASEQKTEVASNVFYTQNKNKKSSTLVLYYRGSRETQTHDPQNYCSAQQASRAHTLHICC